MRFTSKALVVLTSAIFVAAPPLVGQSPAPKWTGSLAIGEAQLPDAFSSACGQPSGIETAGELHAGVQYHPRSPWFFELNNRTVMGPSNLVCDLAIRIQQIGPNEFETVPGITYPPGVSTGTMNISMLRAGVETRPGVLFARGSVGGGLVWGRQDLPVGSIAAAIGTSRHNASLYIEAEKTVSRIRDYDVRGRFRSDSSGQVTPLGTVVTTMVVHPNWLDVRVGVGFAL